MQEIGKGMLCFQGFAELLEYAWLQSKRKNEESLILNIIKAKFIIVEMLRLEILTGSIRRVFFIFLFNNGFQQPSKNKVM